MIQTRPDQTRPDQTRPDQTRPGQGELSLPGSVFTVKADARLLLGWACDVAKGAAFYSENFDCNALGDEGQRIFSNACLGLIGFTLDAIDAHFCALDEAGGYNKDNACFEAKIDYTDRREGTQ